jgi:hypothetical protein
MKHDATLMTEAPTCSMPEHGREDAPATCCRPSSPQFAGFAKTTTTVSRLNWLQFWGDRRVWAVASRNTLNCLIGCMLGDFAVVIYMQAYHSHAPMALTMGLAMVAGLITSVFFETCMLKLKEGFGWRAAVTTAFSMSFLSMLGMEFAANATDFMLTGGRVPFSDPFYWTALAISLGAGFLAPLPYNYWKFKRHGRACH